MLPMPDDLDSDDLGSTPNQRADTLETLLSRPPSWRRRLFLSSVVLVLMAIALVIIWRLSLPVLRSAFATSTPPLTTTETLAIAGKVSATIHLEAVHAH